MVFIQKALHRVLYELICQGLLTPRRPCGVDLPQTQFLKVTPTFSVSFEPKVNRKTKKSQMQFES